MMGKRMESQCYKYKMQKDDLRKLTVEIFEYHGVSPNWIRELLPEGLKYTSKTRISYLHRQEIEKERQRVLQSQEAPSSSSEFSSEFESANPGSKFNSGEYAPTDYVVLKSESLDKNIPSEEDKIDGERSNMTKKIACCIRF